MLAQSAKRHSRASSRLLILVGIISLSIFLLFTPSNAEAIFHDFKPPPIKSSLKKPSPTPKVRVARAPAKQIDLKIDNLIRDAFKRFTQEVDLLAGLLWPLDEVKIPVPSSSARAAVLGAKTGPNVGSAIGNFFDKIGNGIAAAADFLWPFDGDKKDQKKTATAQKAQTSSQTTPTVSPTPSTSEPTQLAQTGDLNVGTASDTSTVVVKVPDEIDNATLTILGNLTWGDSHDDRLKLKGLLASDLLLDANKTYTLGNNGERFKAGYFSDNIYVGSDKLTVNSDGFSVKGSVYINANSGGSIYLDSDSNTLYLGAGTNILSNADSAALTIDPTGSNRVQFHSASNFIDSSGNMTIAGTLTSTGGATSSDSIDITPSTNIDALDITGTNITTADLIDLDADATTTGDAIDINMANTRTSGSAILITDASVAATVTGDLIQINVTGTPDTNTIDIDYTGGISGNVIDITSATAASSGNMIDLNFGAVLDTGDAVNIALGATAVGAQALVVTSGAMTRTTDLVSITDSGTSSGDTLEIALTGATTGHGIFLNNDAMVATGNVLYIDSDADRSSTSLLVIDDIADDTASAPTIDINLTAASDQPIINIDTAASNGSVIDLNHTLADVTVQTYLIRGTYTDTADAEADFLLFEDAGGTAQFLIAQDGNTTITGTADGTAALTLTTGDLVITDGDLTVSGGDVNFTTDAGDTLNIAKGAAATADVVLIAAGSPATDGVDALALTMTTTDQTNITNSVINILLTSGGTAATDIARGLFIDLASTAGGNDTAIEIENTAAWDVDIALQFDETISNVTDDNLVFTGVGGTNNTSITLDLDGASATNVPAIVSGGSDLVTVFDSLSVGINGETTENIASSDFAFSGGNDLYVDDKFGVNGTASIDGNLWQGDAVTTTTKTTAFLFLGTTAGAPTGDPATPAGFAAIVYDTTNNKICADEEAAGAAWLCTGALVDIAEWMPAAGAESGDLVSVTNLANPTEDPTAPFMLGVTTKPYDNNLVGVISKYAEDAESALGYKRSADYHAVTLVGRVPVKVSGENGPIARGDYLTSSSTPGYAMKATKAGSVAGMALEEFSGDKGVFMAFIKAAWYDPVEEQKRAVLAALGLGTLPTIPTAGEVAGASTTAGATTGTSPLVGPAADGSLGVLVEEVDLLVHGLLTANNLRVKTAAEFEGTLVVKGLATFEGDLVVKGAFSTGSLDLSGALTKTMTAGSDLSAGDPVVVTGANTVARAGGPSANVVGLAATSASSGSSVKVGVAGTVGGYSGLSTGSRYYVGSGGVVTTAPGGDRAVHIGIAVSGSEMIVQIFESAAPPAPPVVDAATVDPGPTVTVDEGTDGTEGGAEPGGETTIPSASPTPSGEPEVLGTSTEPSPQPTPTASPETSVSPAP